MLKIITNLSAKQKINNFSVFLCCGIFILIFNIFVSFSKAEAAVLEDNSSNYITTDAIAKEIEKTLLFNKESREKIDFYKKKRKSDVIVSDQDSKSSKDSIDIAVFEPKSQNSIVREQEKLAYNASVVGQYEVSIELYKKVLAAEPNNVYSKFSLAVVYQKIGQFRQAKALYSQLLKEESVDKEEIIGNLLAIMVEETPKDTVYLLNRLAAENPDSSYILAQSAIAYDKIKNYDQAISLLKKAITLDPNRIDYKYNLAVIYDKTSDFENALGLYSEVTKGYTDENSSIQIDQVNQRVEAIRSKS